MEGIVPPAKVTRSQIPKIPELRGIGKSSSQYPPLTDRETEALRGPKSPGDVHAVGLPCAFSSTSACCFNHYVA